MSTKFSEFTIGTAFGNADIVVGLQADNVQVTRALLLTAPHGEPIYITACDNDAAGIINDGGDAWMFVDDGPDAKVQADGDVIISDTSTSYGLFLNSAGTVVVQMKANQQTVFREGASNVWLSRDDSTGTTHLIGQTINIDWNNTGTPSMWMTSSPNYYQDAIDRIAAAVFGLLGGQIP